MADAPNLEAGSGDPAPDAMLHEIKVNGVVEHLTLDELKTRAQKVSAADKYLQDASKTAKDHEKAIKGWNALLKAKSGDRDALREGFQELGVPDSVFNEYMATMEAELKGGSGAPSNNGNGGSGGRPNSGGGNGSGSPDPAVTEVVEFLKAAKEEGVNPVQAMKLLAVQHKKSGEESFKTSLAEALRKDPVVGPIMRDKGKGASLVSLTRDVVIRRMAMENRSLTDDLVQAAIQEIRGTAKSLGLGDGDHDPVALGAAPGLGIGSASHQKPQKRPDASDDQAHAAWVSSRMRSIMRETEGEPVDGFFG